MAAPGLVHAVPLGHSRHLLFYDPSGMHLAILGMVRCPVAPGSCAPPTALLCSSYSVSLSARQVDAACVRVWGVGGCGLWMCGGVGIYLLGSLLRLVFFLPFSFRRLSPWYSFGFSLFIFYFLSGVYFLGNLLLLVPRHFSAHEVQENS